MPHRDPETAEFQRIWTLPGLRRQGIARRVLQELEDQAARQGYRRVFLTTGFRQPEAVGLYLSHGYTALFDLQADPETIAHLPRKLCCTEPTHEYAVDCTGWNRRTPFTGAGTRAEDRAGPASVAGVRHRAGVGADPDRAAIGAGQSALGLGYVRRVVLRAPGAGRLGPHAAADCTGYRPGLRAGHPACAGARLRLATAVGGVVGLRLAVPLDPAAGAVVAAEQPGLPVQHHRTGCAVHRHQPVLVPDHPADRCVHGGGAGPYVEPGRILGRSDPRWHPVGGPWPVRGGSRTWPAAWPPSAPHHPAAGDALDPAGGVQRCDRPGQEHLGGLRAGAAGAVLHRAGDLPAQPGSGAVADGGHGLVPGDPDSAVAAAATGGAALCARPTAARALGIAGRGRGGVAAWRRQGIRRPAGAGGREPGPARRQRYRADWPVRRRQVHAAAADQPPGTRRQRLRDRRRPADRLPP
ncbi:hypothetical protein G6F22_012754 [Rhizopus arrhizus]|nr:hypothetical protein G6F22_012754 [Rhizopus arrhizus]